MTKETLIEKLAEPFAKGLGSGIQAGVMLRFMGVPAEQMYPVTFTAIVTVSGVRREIVSGLSAGVGAGTGVVAGYLLGEYAQDALAWIANNTDQMYHYLTQSK